MDRTLITARDPYIWGHPDAEIVLASNSSPFGNDVQPAITTDGLTGPEFKVTNQFSRGECACGLIVALLNYPALNCQLFKHRWLGRRSPTWSSPYHKLVASVRLLVHY